MSNKRYVTTWTSEDAINYRLYIIPSNANYAGGSTDVTLPSDFLLRDMTLDTELGELPVGMMSQVLKLSFNIASLEGTADLNNLRIQLLKGSTTKKFPLTVTGTDLIGNANSWFDAASVLADKEFDCFNTFVLQYNDGTGWKVSFIGCQKYSAENELEVTTLQSIIRYDVEAYDIIRCIGEMIKPAVWQYLLRCDSTLINYDGATGIYAENTEHRSYILGYYFKEGKYTRAVDTLPNNFYLHISTFGRLRDKISAMYSAYMRAITQNFQASYVCNSFYTNTITFFDQWLDADIPIGTPLSPSTLQLCYIAEIWQIEQGDTAPRLVSGAHADVNMFAEYKTFYDVLRAMNDSMVEIVKFDYAMVAANPDRYTVTATASNPYPAVTGTSITFTRANTYASFKLKLFSETLQVAKVALAAVREGGDTESYEYGEGAEGSMTKDLKQMFHNYTLITDRNEFGPGDFELTDPWTTRGKAWIRRTVNPATILTIRYPKNEWYGGLADIIKVGIKTRITFGGETIETDSQLRYLDNPTMDILYEQRFAGSAYTTARALVEFYGRKTQAEATLTTTYVAAKQNQVGNRCVVNLSDYNSLLFDAYSSATARGVLFKHSHKVYEGMVEVGIRIDGEAQ